MYLKLPTDRLRDPFWKMVRRYQELSGEWSGGSPINVVCLATYEDELDGRLPISNADALEDVIGWKGKKGRAEAAMLEAGLIEKEDGSYRVAGAVWQALGGHLLKFRLRAKKAAKALHRRVTVDATSTA